MIRHVAFYDLTEDEFKDSIARIAGAAIEGARLVATERLLAGPATGIGDEPAAATAVLMERDPGDGRYELLGAFEKPWALLVLRLLVRVVADPAAAVRDARDRGATVSEIAAALGITEQAVYSRYKENVVRQPRAKQVPPPVGDE